MDLSPRLARRSRKVQFSGIRKFFELAGRLKDPCDLSIGLPDYDAPKSVKRAAVGAIKDGPNRYPPSAGLPKVAHRKVVVGGKSKKKAPEGEEGAEAAPGDETAEKK